MAPGTDALANAEWVAQTVARFLRLPAPSTPDDPDALAQLRFKWRQLAEDKRDFEQMYYTALYTLKGDPGATDAEREQAKIDVENAAGWMSDAEGKAILIEEEAQRLKSASGARVPTTAPTLAPAPVTRTRSARSRERRARRAASRSSGGGDSDSSGESEPPPLVLGVAS